MFGWMGRLSFGSPSCTRRFPKLGLGRFARETARVESDPGFTEPSTFGSYAGVDVIGGLSPGIGAELM